MVAALQHYLGIGDVETFKAATAFTGAGTYIYEPIDQGFASGSEMCGALCGGVMAIGSVYGRSEYIEGIGAHEQPEYMESILRSRKFCHKYHQRFGSLRCSDVKMTVRGPNWMKYSSHGTVEALSDHDKCGEVAGAAARLVAEVILEPTEYYTPIINRETELIRKVREQQKSQP
ncbi:C-GCAxxG-C-C family protein [Chloroflexota bacterium]